MVTCPRLPSLFGEVRRGIGPYMAGGTLAEEAVCMVCLGDGKLTRAVRVHEGQEDDQYRCEKGHTFGMDFRTGPATEPLWPPSPELETFVKG